MLLADELIEAPRAPGSGQCLKAHARCRFEDRAVPARIAKRVKGKEYTPDVMTATIAANRRIFK
ncbi:hypothetical protein [Salinisphaera japonica]|uniref:hypothetical protein n=1 Tax=Salinisphaera japonica TaxID=1304270 RepID=UPI00160BE763|nr:hypothetical protein [Salinisphaera japonica]